MSSKISNILKGSIDIHVHVSPDTQERRMDALDAARSAYEYEMGGFVLKSTHIQLHHLLMFLHVCIQM